MNTLEQLAASTGSRTRRVSQAAPVAALAPNRAATGISRLLASVAWQVRRQGIARNTGFALMLAAALILLLAVLPLRREAAAFRSQITTSRTTTADTARPPPDATRAFVAGLPLQSELADVLDSLYSESGKAGIQMQKGSYSYVPDRNVAVGRYEMTLPVQGTYKAIRSFVDGSLAANPALALDSMRMERDSIQSDELVVELKFVAFVRSAQ